MKSSIKPAKNDAYQPAQLGLQNIRVVPQQSDCRNQRQQLRFVQLHNSCAFGKFVGQKTMMGVDHRQEGCFFYLGVKD